MTGVMLFLGGFSAGILFTLICGFYLSDKIEQKEGRKL